ncbi:MAG: redoxin domain-containing protein [Isosphaeraceae bacterium]|nr:redoxin domain-containing protein [Isosphaeraceae bacterium]
MRTLRISLATLALLGAAPAGHAQAQYSPSDLLSAFRPSQKGVEYDTPTGKAVEACKVETVYDKNHKPIGYALRDGEGKLLRKFVDTNGLKNAKGQTQLDQWSYYKDGFEVYRENDLNEDKSLDECRWMNAGGTRIAALKSDGTVARIVAWKRISAEEASKVLVQALVANDLGLLETVMATPAELEALGLPAGQVKQAAEAAANRRTAFDALRKTLFNAGWDGQTVWSRFDGTMPHVIPADAAPGLKEDIILYENGVIFAGPPNGQGDPLKIAYLQAGEMIKLGETWKFLALPFAIDPRNTEPPQVAADNTLRAWIFRQANSAPDAGPASPELVKAQEALAKHDATPPGPSATKVEIAQFYRDRVELLYAVAKLATGDEQMTYLKQVADSLAAAYQTGAYPEGGKILDRLIAKGGKLAPYAAYHKILAEYSLDAEQPGANLLEVQKKCLAKLEDFLKTYRDCDEVPEVLFQLATVNEFNGDDKEARDYYARLAKDYPTTEPGKKAVGALRRLDLVDKPITLSGPNLRGQKVGVENYRGKNLLIVFWSTQAAQFRKDLPDLEKAYQKYHSKAGLEILGVNLDDDKAALEAFLRETSLPWEQIYEPGGMSSRLANEFGILTLPTMFLVGPDGKVISRNIRMADELEKYLEKALTSKAASVDLGSK